jgi:4-amino-4-deoxy-L-arabinose transferase-like glycosyltransferase
LEVTETPPASAPPGAARFLWARLFRWLEPVVLVLLALALNVAGNSRTGLWDRDEPRYAVCVREMRARGDWVFPTFNGEPRYHKPILIYWLMRLGTALGGDNPFGARLVSVGAGAGMVLAVWLLGRQMFGPTAGRLAALIMATAPIVIAEAKLATTDATLALLLFGCQTCLWVLGQRESRAVAGVFWILLSMATLTKGPIGPSMIAVASLFAWWWGWPASTWRRLYWRRGMLGFLLLTAPWYLLISVASRGEFLEFAVGNEIVNRITTDMQDHGGFPGYYPVISALAFYPWSALVPAAIVGAWLRRKSNRHLGFLLGWAIGPFLLLECFRTKLIHYYLPAIPACALLVAWLAQSVSTEGVNIRRRPLGRLGMALLVGIGMAGTVLLVAGATIAPWNLSFPLALMAVAIGAGTLLGLSSFQKGDTERAVYLLVAAWAVIMLVFTGWLIPLAEPFRASRVVGERLASLSARMGIEPVLLEYQEPGVVYALGRSIATTRDRDGFFMHLEGGRAVLTVGLESDFEKIRAKHGLTVTPVDQVEGFVFTKGQKQTLVVAVVKKDESPPVSSFSSATAAVGNSIEKTIIK